MTAPALPAAPIVKLGGSLFGRRELDGLLDVAARRGALVVAGGGVFADGVRTAQAAFGFDDAAAHRMAIFAMEQGAGLLAARRPDFLTCADLDDIEAAASAGRPALWSPAGLALAADLPASWEVTSDSLALWLGIATSAPQVVLVKSGPVRGQNAAGWADAGLVDPYLPRLAARFQGRLACVGEASAAALDAALAPGRVAA